MDQTECKTEIAGALIDTGENQGCATVLSACSSIIVSGSADGDQSTCNDESNAENKVRQMPNATRATTLATEIVPVEESKNEDCAPGVETRRAEDEESKSERCVPSQETPANRDASRPPGNNAQQQDDAVPVLKLKDLKPSTPSPWAFIALIVARIPVRDWKSLQDAGTLLEAYVAGSLHGCTRVTLFTAAVDKYRDVVAPGKTCYFTGGRVKRTVSSNNGVEITFGSDSDIHEVCPLSIVPQLSAVLLEGIAAIDGGSTATTIAVVHALGALKRIVTKKGNTTEKRELLLVDDSGYKMVCTTWGQLARVNEDLSEGSVIVVKDGIPNTYNGFWSISIGVGSDMLHEPGTHSRGPTARMVQRFAARPLVLASYSVVVANTKRTTTSILNGSCCPLYVTARTRQAEEMEAPASLVKPHAESPRAIGEPEAAAASPSTPTESDVAEVETEKSPVAAQLELHKPHEDGAESDRARTDSDDEDEELHTQEEVVAAVQEPTTPVEAHAEPTTPVEHPPEQTFEDETAAAAAVEKELMVQERETEVQSPPPSPAAESVGVEEIENVEMQVREVELKVQDDEVQEHEVELVIPSPKRPAPLNLVHHDIDDEASDSDEMEGGAAGEDDEEGADLGTPLGYGGAADFGEGQDEFTSHRFLGPSVASDPSSARALHSLRHVALHDKPPRFASEAASAVASSGSVTSSGESSGRNSSSASAIHAPDAKSGLRSQSEADYMENPLNTYTLTFTDQVLGFNTNVVVSLENELLVEVWSVEKDSPAQRGGVVVGDYLISVNGQHIEPHMTKEQVFEIIQTSTVPRTLVFQRDLHDKDGAQSKSLPDKKHSAGKPLMGRLGAAMSQGASIIGSKWKRKKTIVHPNSFCDGCGMDPIVGALWTCSVCSNYNLCSECYDVGTHGMENTEQMQALSEAIVQFKLQKKCKYFTPEFLLSLRRDICKGRPDKFEYLGEWIANIVVGTSAAKITVRGIEIPSLPPVARQRFVSYLMPLVSNRTDIEVNIEWLPDDADHINAAGRASVDRMSAGAYASGDEEGNDDPPDNLEKLRIWISDKKTRTTSPFA